MDNDIVPALLAMIEQDFDEQTYSSTKLRAALKQLQVKKASYKDVNDYAIEVGEILSGVFEKHVTSDILPDGRMYFNIANRIMNPTMKKNHELITGYASDVQYQLNNDAGIKIQSQVPEVNQERIDGIVNRVSSESDFEKIKWILDEPIVNFSQSIVDDTIKINAEFHGKAGLSPKITRIVSGHSPCEWCRSLAGTYNYADAPDDVYRRHERCRCTVDYNPGDGKRQNVWTKEWNESQLEEKIAQRNQMIETDEHREARKLIRIAKNAEKDVTKDLLSISDNLGTEMVGMDYRLKTPESLARKLENDPNAKMKDVLRYTNVSTLENQVADYFKTIEQLEEKGYTVSTVKNYWLNEYNPYNGVNINLLTPSDYEFELQFHTPDSFDLKNGDLHSLYEKARMISDSESQELIQLQDEMFALSDKIVSPKNIESIKDVR